MYAAESNAPEGPGAQAPDLRGGRAYGPGRNARIAGRPRMRGGAKRPADAALPPEPPPSASAPPRWSCRHPVCGRVSRTRGARGAYNTELAAAKGRSPEGGASRGPRDGRQKLSEKSS